MNGVGSDLKKPISPVWYAAGCAILYLIISSLWVVFSSRFAQSEAASVEDLARTEMRKGIGFVVFSSLLFFYFSVFAFRRTSLALQQLMQSQQKLVQTEREAITGLLAASMAHDFTNLLTVIRLNAERIKSVTGFPPEAADSFAKLDQSVVRLTELAARLRTAGQNLFKDRPRSFDLNRAISETVGLLRSHRATEKTRIEFEPKDSPQSIGYPILIHQLLMNLVLNAAEATDDSGVVKILAYRKGDGAMIEVHDNGPGIPPLLRETIFEAFFTTKQFGTGLGLISVKSCVEIYGGTVNVTDSPLGGALFQVYLPDVGERRALELKHAEFLNKTSMSQGTLA